MFGYIKAEIILHMIFLTLLLPTKAQFGNVGGQMKRCSMKTLDHILNCNN